MTSILGGGPLATVHLLSPRRRALDQRVSAHRGIDRKADAQRAAVAIMINTRLATSHAEVLRAMSGAHGLIVSALAALCLSLALSACGDRASESLKPGPLTPEARKRAAELGDDRTFLEARQALRGFGRDAVPALVEVLEGWAGPQSKGRAAEVLGDLG